MFQLDQEKTYWYPVAVEMTAKEGGRRQKFTFDGEFNRLPQDEITELFRSRSEDETPLKDADVLERVFVGWRHVQDAEGRPLEVTPENREALLSRFPVSSCVVKAFFKSLGVEGKAKN